MNTYLKTKSRMANYCKIMALAVMMVCLLGVNVGFAANEAASAKTVKTIKFPGGSCTVEGIDLNPMFAPADMQDGEKPFMVSFKYTLDKPGPDKDGATSALYNDGIFVAPDGATYVAGAGAINETTQVYMLVVAVPEKVIITSLEFVYKGQKVALKDYAGTK